MIAWNWLGRWEKLYFNRLLKTGKNPFDQANAHQQAIIKKI